MKPLIELSFMPELVHLRVNLYDCSGAGLTRVVLCCSSPLRTRLSSTTRSLTPLLVVVPVLACLRGAGQHLAAQELPRVQQAAGRAVHAPHRTLRCPGAPPRLVVMRARSLRLGVVLLTASRPWLITVLQLQLVFQEVHKWPVEGEVFLLALFSCHTQR